MVDPRVQVGTELLVGYEGDASAVYLGYAVLLAALAFVVVASVWGGLAVFGFERFRSLARPLLLAVCVLAACLAGLHGYGNDGLLVSTAVALAPFTGLLAWGAVAVGLELPAPAAGQAGLDRLTLLGAAAGVGLALVGTAVGRLTSADPDRRRREGPPDSADPGSVDPEK